MAKTQQTWNKREKEKQRLKKREDKIKKKEARKANAEGADFENMLAYVDENGNISSTPPDPASRKKISAESIEISIPRKENIEDSDEERTGTVAFFNESKGYGFIRDTETRESIFMHVHNSIDVVKENDKVTFRVEQGQKGPVAVNIRLLK